MDRIWQSIWDRHGPRYSWAMLTVVFVPLLTTFLIVSFAVVAVNESGAYLEACVVTAALVAVNVFVVILPRGRLFRSVQQWAAGGDIDRGQALRDTYRWTRAAGARALWFLPVWTAALLGIVAAIPGAGGSRLVQYAIVGAALGFGMALIGTHTSLQGALRPVRVALAGDTAIGDDLPRPEPTFAVWLNLAMVGSFFTFAVGGALLAVVWGPISGTPVLFAVIGCVWACLGASITSGGIIAPSLRPIRDLDEATRRVAAGDYSQRLPVVQDDDLGALAASFNRMQAGLAE